MKVNLGSHSKRIKGYTNVDALDLPEVDIVHDLTEYPYPFKDNSVEEILMTEVLEHISWRETLNVLRECYRILKPHGKLHIQVPDCGSMMWAYCGEAIGDEIPHKPKSEEEARKAQKRYAKLVNPMRWLMSFTGAGKHKFDYHLNIFTKERMEEYLSDAGFDRIDFIEDKLKWKIKVNAIK